MRNVFYFAQSRFNAKSADRQPFKVYDVGYGRKWNRHSIYIMNGLHKQSK